MIDKTALTKSPWGLSIEKVRSVFASHEDGLSAGQAKERLAIFGYNELSQSRQLTRFGIFIRQFKSPLIFVLLIAAAITFSLGDYHDGVFILLAACINAVLGFYQENKAERALEHLKTYVVKRVRVLREGVRSEIDAKELVPGDVIYLSQGDRVPADARVVYVNDLLVDQAILTGESMPVEKSLAPVAVSAPVADRDCMVFSGTSVVGGVGEAIVVATDEQTELGKIAKLVARPEEEVTPLQTAITRFSLHTSIVMLIFSAIVFFIARSSGLALLEAFLISVAILIAAVPEGLPVVMTVILAIGVQRLARKNGVVRRLAAAETLGSTTVILTDKTGTLTQAKMSLSTLRTYGGASPDSALEEFMLYVALLNADVIIENPKDDPSAWRVTGRPVDVAIARAGASRGLLLGDIKEGKRAVHILPFNSKNKFAATVHPVAGKFAHRLSAPGGHLLSLFGAPEVLLGFSNHTEAERAAILKDVEQLAAKGERVVGVAFKEVRDIVDFSLKEHRHLHGVTFLGFVAFKDPLRPTVKDAMDQVRSAGVKVVIVTGDHAATAIAVAKELGIDVAPSAVLVGTELDALSDKELFDRVPLLQVISRVSPEGKMRIVKAFRAHGEVVAMNGDGINDAPALKEADIGVAMGTGTDVAKDVSDLVLLDDNFETIVQAVHEGHRILANIRKAIVYLLSTVLNEIVLIGGALILGIALPLSALQILWVNFFTDSFPGIALAFEDKIDKLSERPVQIRKGIFTPSMRAVLFINTTVSSVLLFFMYIALLEWGFEQTLVRSFIFAAFGTYSLFAIFAVRSLRRSIFHYNPFSNPSLLGAVTIGLVLMAAAIYLPILQKLLDTVALPPIWVFAVFIFGIVNVLVIEASKALFRGREAV